MERSNPLPPNARYWVQVSPADQPAFKAWLAANKGAVLVRSTQRDSDNGWDWVLFDVAAPLVWWEGPGYPTKAAADVRSESDVVSIPVVESGVDKLDRLGSAAASAVGDISTKAAIAGVAILIAIVVLNRVMR